MLIQTSSGPAVALRSSFRSCCSIAAAFALRLGALAFAVSGAASSQALAGYVTMHQMVVIPRAGTMPSIDDCEKETRQWQAMGLDFVLLFEAENLQHWHDIALCYYEAAARHGFKLALSTTYTDLNDRPRQELFRDLLRKTSSEWPWRDAQFRAPDGRYFVSGYNASAGRYTVLDEVLGGGNYYDQSFYFPRSEASLFGTYEAGGATFQTPETLAVLFQHRDMSRAAGFAQFNIGSVTPQNAADMTTDFVNAGQIFNRSARVNAVPYYRGHSGKGNPVAYESHGYQMMQAMFKAAVDSGAQWLELLTGNDVSEGTYFNAFDDADSPILVHHWLQQEHAPILSHQGFREFAKRYIAGIKQGWLPPITQDELYYTYRLHPRSARTWAELSSGERNSLSGWRSGGQDDSAMHLIYQRPHWSEKAGVMTMSDGIHVAVRLTAPADVYINGTLVGANLPAGEHTLVKTGQYHDGTQPVYGYPQYTFGPQDYGHPTFEIRRNGQTVVRHTGELEITPYVVPGNWHYFARKAP